MSNTKSVSIGCGGCLPTGEGAAHPGNAWECDACAAYHKAHPETRRAWAPETAPSSADPSLPAVLDRITLPGALVAVTEPTAPTVDDYEAFIRTKLRLQPPTGIADPKPTSPHLFPWQAAAVRKLLQLGRAAFFADCGLGKGPCCLEWARHVVEHTGRSVLILAPLAVAQQFVREGVKFNTPCTYVREAGELGSVGVYVTNYERLGKFDASVFGGVVLDESSILKSFMGATKQALMTAFARTPFRLAASATPAPNDHMELGNHAEFLGVLTSHEMLARWFINDTSTFGTYRLKGHAVDAFWDWVSSWALCIGKPSDFGPYSDDGYVLPELVEVVHTVDVDITAGRGVDYGGQMQLVRSPDLSATSVHREKRITLADRAREVARIVAAEPDESWLIWCETDYEDDALRASLGAIGADEWSRRVARAETDVPRVVSVRGSDKIESKERAIMAFQDGAIKTLVTKSKIAGYGLNLQCCARMVESSASFSYESYYQKVRRAWRFGQSRSVHLHVVMGATEVPVWQTMLRKANEHEQMKVHMYAAMRRAQAAKDDAALRYVAGKQAALPQWLRSVA